MDLMGLTLDSGTSAVHKSTTHNKHRFFDATHLNF